MQACSLLSYTVQEPLNRECTAHSGLCLPLLSIARRKCHDQKQLGEERVCFWLVIVYSLLGVFSMAP